MFTQSLYEGVKLTMYAQEGEKVFQLLVGGELEAAHEAYSRGISRWAGRR